MGSVSTVLGWLLKQTRMYFLLKIFVRIESFVFPWGREVFCNTGTHLVFGSGGNTQIQNVGQNLPSYRKCSEKQNLFNPCFSKMTSLKRYLFVNASLSLLISNVLFGLGWLSPIFRRQWIQMLRIEQGDDKGWVDQIFCSAGVVETEVGDTDTEIALLFVSLKIAARNFQTETHAGQLL